MPLLLSLICICTVLTDQKHLTVPASWSRDFSIHYSSGGGMINESYRADFYYDSAVYEKRVGEQKIRKCVRLNDKKRQGILTALRALEIEKITSRSTPLRLDAGSTNVCFNTNGVETCLSDGATEEVPSGEYDRFAAVYEYLKNYANPGKK